MKKIRWYIWVSLTLVMLSGLLFLGWIIFSRMQQPQESPLNAIPGNTAIILKVNRPINLWNTLHQNNRMWQHFAGFPGMNSLNTELTRLDSMARKHLDISGIIERNSLYLTVTLSGRSTFGLLFLTQVPGKTPASSITEFIQSYSNDQALIIKNPYGETSIYRIQMKGDETPFYFAVFKGVFMASKHADLVKKSIDRLSLNAPGFLSSGFRRVESTTGKKADLNLFVNFRFLSLFLYKQSKAEYIPEFLRLSKYADWCGADIILKNDELLLGGYTVAHDTSLHYLSLFEEQKPQQITLTEVIPSSVRWIVFQGFDNPAFYLRELHQRMPQESVTEGSRTLLETFNQVHQTDLSRYFTPWLGNQVAVFSFGSPPSDLKSPLLAVVESRDPGLSVLMIDSVCRIAGQRLDSMNYDGFSVYSTGFGGIIPALFGHLFSHVGDQYFSRLDRFLVFSSDLNLLKEVVDAYGQGLTLKNDPVYRHFSGEISPAANLYLYFNPQMGLATLKGLLNEDLVRSILPVYDSLVKIEGLSFQFSNQEDIFYTSGFLRFNPTLTLKGPLQWETQLDTTITGRPRILPDSRPQGSCILVTDTLNNLYCLNNEGTIRWKVHFMGRRLSDFTPLKLPSDDSLYYLFNTDSHLYLIRSDGTLAPKYPLRFPIPATNPLTVTDFGIPGNYSVFIAFNDKRLYQFSLDGTSVSTWNRPALNHDIAGQVDYISFRNRDYLCIRSTGGESMVVKRSGSPVFRFRPPLKKAPATGFYINRSNKRGILLTTDEKGNIIYIRDDGRTSSTLLTPLDKNHYLFYEDLTGSGSPEFILVDNTRLFFYDRSLRLIYNYSFRREITAPPFLVRIPGEKPMLGVTIPATRELFLFDGKGARKMEPGIRGTTPFDLGYVDHPRRVSLIVGNGKFLRNYRLTKP